MSQPKHRANPETMTDRRSSRRVSFAARLSISTSGGTTIPSDDLFHPVKAVNLSQTGLSFTTTQWPGSDELLVRFSDHSKPRHATARVIACRREELDGGESRFEVRCEFGEWLPTGKQDGEA
jgi:hypothetical protein